MTLFDTEIPKVGIYLKQVCDDEDREIAREIVEKHHSYVPTYTSVGRRIDWLIYVDGELSGMIGIGSSTYPPCKDLLTRLSVSKAEYRKIFNSVANNWRFCMCRSVKNVGTRVLKELRRLAPLAWEEKYGDELKYIITFVGGGHNGAVYKADNWEVIGMTAGLPKHSSVSMKWDDNGTIKSKFVKPDGKDRKIIFFKEIK